MHRQIPTKLPSTLFGLAPVACLFGLAQLLGVAFSPIAEAAEIQVTDLADIDFGEVPPTVGTLRANSSLCVSMRPRGRYSLVGFGNGTGGAFSLVDSGNGVHTLDYRVRISDRGNNRGRPLIAGVPLTDLRASRFRNNGRCNPQGRIRVIIDGADIQSARPGQYNGALTLTVVPE